MLRPNRNMLSKAALGGGAVSLALSISTSLAAQAAGNSSARMQSGGHYAQRFAVAGHVTTPTPFIRRSVSPRPVM